MPWYTFKVRKVLKKYVIPHEGNNHTPHLLRKSGAFCLLAVIVGLFGLSAAQVAIIKHTNFAAVLTPVLVDLTNADRETQNVSVLKVSPLLAQAAQMKADDMATKGYFAHVSPEGLSPWHWFDAVGYNFTYAGENLAINFTESKDVETAWMNSPGHRSNILNDKFTEIGIATQNGTYQGQATIFVAQMFGRPAPASVRASVVKPVAQAINKPQKIAVETPVGSVKSAATTTITDAAPQLRTVASQDMFLAVENVGTDTQPVAPAAIVNATGATAGTTDSSLLAHTLEKIFFAPRKVLEFAYSAIAALILLVMGLIILGEYRRHHVHNVSYAAGLLATMAVFMYLLTTLIPHVIVV